MTMVSQFQFLDRSSLCRGVAPAEQNHGPSGGTGGRASKELSSPLALFPPLHPKTLPSLLLLLPRLPRPPQREAPRPSGARGR